MKWLAGMFVVAVTAVTAVGQQSPPGKVKVYRLDNVPASRAARFVKGLLGETENPVHLVADERTNSLLVSSSEVPDVDRFLKAFDAAFRDPRRTSPVQSKNKRVVVPDPGVERIALEFAPAQECAGLVYPLINGLFDTPVRVVADPRTNAILVTGKPADRARVRQIVTLIDIEAKPKEAPPAQAKASPQKAVMAFERITLEHAEALPISQVVSNLFGHLASTPYTIIPDGRTNSLLFVVAKRDLPRVHEIVTAIDIKAEGAEKR